MDHKILPIKFKGLRHLLAIPFILGMSVPLVFFDFFMEIYHRVAFPLYGIATIKRHEYIKIDRHKLSYLNIFDKVWCAYCGYANGLMAYAVEIAACTEQYWCAIKHQPDPNFHEPKHHKNFLPYNDEKAYRDYIKRAR